MVRTCLVCMGEILVFLGDDVIVGDEDDVDDGCITLSSELGGELL